jgi:hypothetical protein
MEINLTVYAVQNNDGKFFRAVGYSGSGSTWVDDINKAKIYPKIGPARRTITWFANNYPEYPVLKLLKLTVSNVEVVDETDRVNKAKIKKEKQELEHKKSMAKYELEQAKRQLLEAQEKIEKLTK